jgi:hypothetical protein
MTNERHLCGRILTKRPVRREGGLGAGDEDRGGRGPAKGISCSGQNQFKPRAAGKLLQTCVLLAGVLACGSDALPDRAEHDSDDTWLGREAEIYVMALDTLESMTRARWRTPDSATSFRVLNTIHWWPMVSSENVLPVTLGPAPLLLSHEITLRHLPFRVVSLQDAVLRNGDLTKGPPLVILGPIDYVGRDEALVSMNLYMGPNGQGVYVIMMRKSDTGWKAAAIKVTVQA